MIALLHFKVGIRLLFEGSWARFHKYDGKQMHYVSTRGKSARYTFTGAVSEGLAPDGGLFVPETLPDISGKLVEWEKLSYPELCLEFLKLFADDIPGKDLADIVKASYEKFDDASIAPLRRLDKDLYMLELYHGPTLAFKDFALQLLGNLYEYILRRSGKKINVLGATSGDTGSAAINGLFGKENVNTFILYPYGRVSPLQERQMACTGAENVFPIAIDGSFDDAQAIVKKLFADVDFKGKYALSAVNSINMARILAQCVYYVWAVLRLDHGARKNVRFIVPTGNFGNVLAGWMAWKMGMPAAGFTVATNSNDILYRLFTSGTYEVLGEAVATYAPSMDIQVSSNFERFIYYMEGCDASKVRNIMETFARDKRWVFEHFEPGCFNSTRMDDDEIARTIKRVYEKYGLVVDPHTACAFKDLPEKETKIVLSTAHPAKFPELIGKVLGFTAKSEALERLMGREIRREHVAADASVVRAYIEKHAIV